MVLISREMKIVHHHKIKLHYKINLLLAKMQKTAKKIQIVVEMFNCRSNLRLTLYT